MSRRGGQTQGKRKKWRGIKNPCDCWYCTQGKWKIHELREIDDDKRLKSDLAEINESEGYDEWLAPFLSPHYDG